MRWRKVGKGATERGPSNHLVGHIARAALGRRVKSFGVKVYQGEKEEELPRRRRWCFGILKGEISAPQSVVIFLCGQSPCRAKVQNWVVGGTVEEQGNQLHVSRITRVVGIGNGIVGSSSEN